MVLRQLHRSCCGASRLVPNDDAPSPLADGPIVTGTTHTLRLLMNRVAFQQLGRHRDPDRRCCHPLARAVPMAYQQGRPRDPRRRREKWQHVSADVTPWSRLTATEREGFEPPVPFGTAVFKTAALNHSATSPVGATPPRRRFLIQSCQPTSERQHTLFATFVAYAARGVANRRDRSATGAPLRRLCRPDHSI